MGRLNATNTLHVKKCCLLRILSSLLCILDLPHRNKNNIVKSSTRVITRAGSSFLTATEEQLGRIKKKCTHPKVSLNFSGVQVKSSSIYRVFCKSSLSSQAALLKFY